MYLLYHVISSGPFFFESIPNNDPKKEENKNKYKYKGKIGTVLGYALMMIRNLENILQKKENFQKILQILYNRQNRKTY